MIVATVPAVNNLALTDHVTNYVYVDYNAGSPQYVVGTDNLVFNCLDKCLAWTISREGTTLHRLDGRAMNVDPGRKHRRLLLECEALRHVIGGTELSEV